MKLGDHDDLILKELVWGNHARGARRGKLRALKMRFWSPGTSREAKIQSGNDAVLEIK